MLKQGCTLWKSAEPAIHLPAGLMNPKKRRPFRGVGPEIRSPAGLMRQIMGAEVLLVKARTPDRHAWMETGI